MKLLKSGFSKLCLITLHFPEVDRLCVILDKSKLRKDVKS